MSDATRMTAEDPPVRTVRITWRSALLAVSVVIGFIAIRGGFIAAHRILGWTAASAAVALVVEPLIDFLGKVMPRALAVVLTFLVIAGAAGGLVYGTVTNLDTEVNRLKDAAPGAVADLEARHDSVGRFATDIHLTERTNTFLDALDQRIGSGSGTLAQNAPEAPIYFVAAILTIFLLVYGPGIADGAARQIDDEFRRRLFSTVLRKAAQRTRRTLAALTAQGVVVGLLAFGVATILGLPAPIVLGLIAGVAGMLPDVGILLGSLPLLALTAALESARMAGLCLAAVFALQAAEALYLRHKVNAFGVEIGPAVVWMVALLGYTIYGPGMAFYGVGYAIFALAVIDQVPAVRAELQAEADAAAAEPAPS